jgi:hypothetical protein
VGVIALRIAMDRQRIDQPSRMIFLAGVVVVIASTSLGLYLASLPVRELPHGDWHYPDFETLQQIRTLAVNQASVVSNVHALMWMTFGLGVTLTLLGLRMMTRPPLTPESPLPIKSIVDVFESRTPSR